MSSFVDVAIIGAGPYGLSLAAHLASAGVNYRLLGRPMSAWQTQMVAGMFLKSDGPSSNLSDPTSDMTLERYCRRESLEYLDRVPIPRETFIQYGLDFQKRFATELDCQTVQQVDQVGDRYSLRLSNDEILNAARVVIAVGVEPFSYIPETLAGLGAERVSHSSKYGAVDHLAGLDVAVIGAGASATDVAYALHHAGARPTIIARRPEIDFQTPPEPQTLMQKLRHPDSGIGGGWRLRVCADAPYLVHALPLELRARIVRNYLGAAPGWFMRERVEGHIPIMTSTVLAGSSIKNNRVRLDLKVAGEAARDLVVDHVVAATGYQVDVNRLNFLPGAMARSIQALAGAPVLSRNFETSVAGLYFMGPAAALSFGPLMRFVHGADYTVRRVSNHLVRGMTRRSVAVPALVNS